LGQPTVADHIIDAGDTLGIYIFGILPANEDETPIVQRTQTVNQQYYPPGGTELGSRTGLPISVDADGAVDLPLVGRISVRGLTMAQAVNRILTKYSEEELLQKDRERVTVTLITPRVKRVVVLREDTPSEPVTLVRPGTNDEIHRGSGRIIDLPIYQNDVLHALAASGGLPGTDAKRELWVIRNLGEAERTYFTPEQLQAWTQQVSIDGCGPQVTRIPLVGCAGAPLPFTTNDILLNDGDVVFVPRRSEHFVTGGLLPGARIPLPRDEDVDVIEAIAIATGSVGGPLGQSGSVLADGSPGFMREPTRVLILRKLPDGRQLPIRVDLDRAMQDEKERILIQNEDVVMLQFKPTAAALNGALNSVRFSIIPRSGR
jgi:protein involved in polysaccharide export with SLBB domain